MIRSEISGGIEEVIFAYKKAFELYQNDIFINKITGNVEHGKQMHEAYLNELSQMQIELEQSRDTRIKKSLKEFTGNDRDARKIFMENKRLQAIVDEKKMMIHG